MESLPWLLPGLGTFIHVRRPPTEAKSEADNTPLCRDGAFVYGFQSGEGLEDAAAANRKWCTPCLAKLRKTKPALVKIMETDDLEEVLLPANSLMGDQSRWV